jgi:hypothetical protein
MSTPTLPDLTRDALRDLAKREHFPSISIYLRTHRAGPDAQQDPVLFRDLLKQAEQQLVERGIAPDDADEILAPAKLLLRDVEFWRHQSEGLAVLVSPDEMLTYSLPYAPPQRVMINTTYAIYPLLPLLTHEARFYVLALSQKSVRVLACSRATVRAVDLPEDMPRSLRAYAKLDDPERQLNYHTSTPQYGSGVAQFHGKGGEAEREKVVLLQFMQEIDRGLRSAIGNDGNPLVLATVDYEAAMFRSASKYTPILDAIIVGNPDHLKPHELRDAAWPIVEAHVQRTLDDVFEAFHSRRHTGLATARLPDIVMKAATGRVDQLIVASDTVVRGQYDPFTLEVHVHADESAEPDDIDLIEMAAVETIRNGGTAHAVDRAAMPDDADAIAVLRPG